MQSAPETLEERWPQPSYGPLVMDPEEIRLGVGRPRRLHGPKRPKEPAVQGPEATDDAVVLLPRGGSREAGTPTYFIGLMCKRWMYVSNT